MIVFVPAVFRKMLQLLFWVNALVLKEQFTLLTLTFKK